MRARPPGERPGERRAPEPAQARAKLSTKNQVVIPKAIRDKLGIQSGDVLLLRAEDGILYAVPEPQDWATALQGVGAEIWDGVEVKEYIRQLREDRDIEPEGS
ncbi:MAG: AbrB/MazE/SpoVT family DNA-binding domain-containing protein [Armatimonadota bacterium]